MHSARMHFVLGSPGALVRGNSCTLLQIYLLALPSSSKCTLPLLHCINTCTILLLLATVPPLCSKCTDTLRKPACSVSRHISKSTRKYTCLLNTIQRSGLIRPLKSHASTSSATINQLAFSCMISHHLLLSTSSFRHSRHSARSKTVLLSYLVGFDTKLRIKYAFIDFCLLASTLIVLDQAHSILVSKQRVQIKPRYDRSQTPFFEHSHQRTVSGGVLTGAGASVEFDYKTVHISNCPHNINKVLLC